MYMLLHICTLIMLIKPKAILLYKQIYLNEVKRKLLTKLWN